MTTTINASTSSGLVATPDNSGTIALQSNGVTKATVSSAGFYAPGSIIQVVGANNTMSGTTITSTSFVTTGLTASITPRFSTSKIYIMATFSMTMDGADNTQSYVTIYRDSTDLRGSGTCLAMYDTPGGDVGFSIPISFYDTPSTTSATSYTVYGKVGSSSSQFRPRTGTDTIVLMEVAV